MISQISVLSTNKTILQTTFTDTALGSVDAVTSGPCKLLSILVDNSANGGAATYICIFNAPAGGLTLGTSAPDSILIIPAGANLEQSFFTGSTPGVTFSTALSIAAKTTGGTSFSAFPSSAVVVSIVYQ